MKERRALLRTRGYYIVLLVACLVAAAQTLILLAKDTLRLGWRHQFLIYPAGTLAALDPRLAVPQAGQGRWPADQPAAVARDPLHPAGFQ